MKAESVFDIIQALPENEYIRLLKMLEAESNRRNKNELKIKELSDEQKDINRRHMKLFGSLKYLK